MKEPATRQEYQDLLRDIIKDCVHDADRDNAASIRLPPLARHEVDRILKAIEPHRDPPADELHLYYVIRHRHLNTSDLSQTVTPWSWWLWNTPNPEGGKFSSAEEALVQHALLYPAERWEAKVYEVIAREVPSAQG